MQSRLDRTVTLCQGNIAEYRLDRTITLCQGEYCRVGWIRLLRSAKRILQSRLGRTVKLARRIMKIRLDRTDQVCPKNIAKYG